MADPFKGPFTVEVGRDLRIAPEYQKLNRFHVIDASGRFASYERTFDEAQWLCDRLNADSYAEGKAAGLEYAATALESAAKQFEERGGDADVSYAQVCRTHADAIRSLATVKP